MQKHTVVNVTVALSGVVSQSTAGEKSRPVCITPISANNLQPLLSVLETVRGKQPVSTKPDPVNISIKVFNPNKKRLCETYVLHNINSSEISTPVQLKKHILNQLGDKVVSTKLNFSVGYIRSGPKFSISSDSDIEDVWQFIHDSIVLWCHGISKSTSESESDYDSSPKRKKTARDHIYGKRVNWYLTFE